MADSTAEAIAENDAAMTAKFTASVTASVTASQKRLVKMHNKLEATAQDTRKTALQNKRWREQVIKDKPQKEAQQRDRELQAATQHQQFQTSAFRDMERRLRDEVQKEVHEEVRKEVQAELQKERDQLAAMIREAAQRFEAMGVKDETQKKVSCPGRGDRPASRLRNLLTSPYPQQPE